MKTCHARAASITLMAREQASGWWQERRQRMRLVSVLVVLGGCGSLVLAEATALAPGVRGVATRAPAEMKIDGDLSEFKDAFCTPVNYFHPDLTNRAAQFF